MSLTPQEAETLRLRIRILRTLDYQAGTDATQQSEKASQVAAKSLDKFITGITEKEE